MTVCEEYQAHDTPVAEGSFDDLVAQYGPFVRSVCRRVLESDLADDATQEVFIKLWSKGGRVNGNLSLWLHRVATTTALDVRRSETRRVARENRVVDG